MNSPTSERPATVYGGLVPTMNHRGFMAEKPDWYSGQFVGYAATLDSEVLDIGCAYGVATHAALAAGARVVACDMDARHLKVLEHETPVPLRDRLRLRQGLLPDIDFDADSFGAILCSRVLHFMIGNDIQRALAKMADWLRSGGRLFVVVDTPYTGFWSATAPEYERRKAAGEAWPGLIEDVGPLLGSGAVPQGMLPHINPMDPDILVRECELAGLAVQEACFTGREGARDGREHAGVIATKA